MKEFDVPLLADFATQAIKEFSEKHKDETFYGFAIDGDLLCLNSEEKFNHTIQEYKEKWGGYDSKEEIDTVYNNTGDWEYQGFAELTEDKGFSNDHYDDFYNLDEDDKLECEYTKAMKAVIALLEANKAFDCLQKTADFSATLVDHNY